MEKDSVELAEGGFGRVIVFRLRPGTDVLGGIEEACRRVSITNGVIVSAIGSLDGVNYCNVIELPATQAGYGYGEILHLTGPIELTGASGIVCHDEDGKINLHVHVSLSDRYGTGHGGHLTEGTKVLMTVDVVVAEITGIEMCRKYDEEMGVMLFSPKQH